MRIADAQIHLFSPDSQEYAAAVHQVILTPEQVIAEMDEAGVERAYLVPAGGSVANDTCLSAARRWPERFRVMGRISLNKPEGRAMMKDWAGQGFAGVRLAFPPLSRSNWLKDGTADWFWPEAERNRIALMIWAPGQLDEIGRLAVRHPGIRFIVDHFGLYVEDKDAAVAPVVANLLPLARHANVAVKASALPAHSTAPWPYRNLHPYIRQVVDAFGSERVMWGTDLTRRACAYDQAVRMFTEELGFLDQKQLEDLMYASATRWIGW